MKKKDNSMRTMLTNIETAVLSDSMWFFPFYLWLLPSYFKSEATGKEGNTLSKVYAVDQCPC